MNACSGDMLLEALVACAGVTLNAVATALGIELRDATLHAEGDIDLRGTPGLSKEIPVGFQNIRLHFDLDTDASERSSLPLSFVSRKGTVSFTKRSYIRLRWQLRASLQAHELFDRNAQPGTPADFAKGSK